MITFMDELNAFLEEHFLTLFVLALVTNIIGFGFLYWRRKSKGLSLPQASDADIVFSESFASASSDKNFFTKMGGASKVLKVIVNQTHLATGTFFPFNLFGEIADIEHLIPISEIKDISQRGKMVFISFITEDGEERTLSIRLRKTEEFLHALKS